MNNQRPHPRQTSPVRVPIVPGRERNRLVSIQQYPYLTAGRNLANTKNSIELHSDIMNGVYANGVARTIIYNTDYRYYKINSVAYPIRDKQTGWFIQKDAFYPVTSRRIELEFPAIDDLGDTENQIYRDEGTLGSAQQVFFLYLILSDNPLVNVRAPRQYLSLKSIAGSGYESQCYFANLDNVVYSMTMSIVTSQLLIAPYVVHYDPASKKFVVLSAGFDLIDDATTAKVKNLQLVKRPGFSTENGLVDSTAKTYSTSEDTFLVGDCRVVSIAIIE